MPIASRLVCSIVLAGVFVAGCSSQPTVNDPVAAINNSKLSDRQRVTAIKEASAQVQSGQANRIAVRDELKQVAWNTGVSVPLRIAALDALIDDPDPAAAADSRELVRLRLARETEYEIITYLSMAAKERGWTDLSAALVRSLSRVKPGVPDEKRAEWDALTALNPGQSMDRIVYGVFLAPPPEPSTLGDDPTVRTRADAWDLLARLDTDGSMRARMVLGEAGSPPPDVPILAQMRKSMEDLRALPMTGEELKWLSSLADPRDQKNVAWWTSARDAIAQIDRERAPSLRLRHAEPIRWATANRPAWVKASREELLATLRERLSGREMHQRTSREQGQAGRLPETVEEWDRALVWADVLTILVVDEALRDQSVADSLIGQTAMDANDKTTEYGGLLVAASPKAAVSPTGEGMFGVALYPPRPGTRKGDSQFVASADMIDRGDQALAHYHFHVQKARNSSYAGPSDADLAYASRYGRTCLVLTSVRDGALDADLYQPDGATIDLGILSRR